MPVVDLQGNAVKAPALTEEEIIERVMMVTQHPSWELFATQLNANAGKYVEQLASPQWHEAFVQEFQSLRSCSAEEVAGFVRGMVSGLRLAAAMPYALQKTADDQRAAHDAEAEEAGDMAATENSEQGNDGKEGFRPAAHPEDLAGDA